MEYPLAVVAVDSPTVAAASCSNPLSEDAMLRSLIDRLGELQYFGEFAQWKTIFLERLESYLEDGGFDAAEAHYQAFRVQQMTPLVQTVKQVEAFLQNGQLSPDQATVTVRRAIAKLQQQLLEASVALVALIPGTSDEAHALGYTKFHMGAVLVEQNFGEYDRLVAVQERLQHWLQHERQNLTDKLVVQEMTRFGTRVETFCAIMADLGLYQAMIKCHSLKEDEDLLLDEGEEEETEEIVEELFEEEVQKVIEDEEVVYDDQEIEQQSDGLAEEESDYTEEEVLDDDDDEMFDEEILDSLPVSSVRPSLSFKNSDEDPMVDSEEDEDSTSQYDLHESEKFNDSNNTEKPCPSKSTKTQPKKSPMRPGMFRGNSLDDMYPSEFNGEEEDADKNKNNEARTQENENGEQPPEIGRSVSNCMRPGMFRGLSIDDFGADDVAFESKEEAPAVPVPTCPSSLKGSSSNTVERGASSNPNSSRKSLRPGLFRGASFDSTSDSDSDTDDSSSSSSSSDSSSDDEKDNSDSSVDQDPKTKKKKLTRRRVSFVSDPNSKAATKDGMNEKIDLCMRYKGIMDPSLQKNTSPKLQVLTSMEDNLAHDKIEARQIGKGPRDPSYENHSPRKNKLGNKSQVSVPPKKRHGILDYSLEAANEQRQKSYVWYSRLGRPDRPKMKRLVEKLPPSCDDISADDVDLLPWSSSGWACDGRKMIALMAAPELAALQKQLK